MYRIEKVLNHNAVIAISTEDIKEYLLLGKGIGFGKKINERIETREEDSIYSLQGSSKRGSANELVKSLSPICLEIADAILNKAQETFGKTDRSIIFPLADHIEFTVKRIQRKESIVNPLTDDIRLLFHAEYKVAEIARELLKRELGIDINEHEIGYIAMHIHAALDEEDISQTAQIAQAVRTCISVVEDEIGASIDVFSLAYNRLMNHIRYMVIRTYTNEPVNVNMNEYMEVRFPRSYKLAQYICDKISTELHLHLQEDEIGYLAVHIERIISII